MIARMIVTGLVALSLSSIPPSYSAGRTPTTQTTQPTPAQIQQPQFAHPSKELHIFIEEDFSFDALFLAGAAAFSTTSKCKFLLRGEIAR